MLAGRGEGGDTLQEKCFKGEGGELLTMSEGNCCKWRHRERRLRSVDGAVVREEERGQIRLAARAAERSFGLDIRPTGATIGLSRTCIHIPSKCFE